MISAGLSKLGVLIFLAVFSVCAGAQANQIASDCSSSEVVLQRYIDAVGGKAVFDVQSRHDDRGGVEQLSWRNRALHLQAQVEGAEQNHRGKALPTYSIPFRFRIPMVRSSLMEKAGVTSIEGNRVMTNRNRNPVRELTHKYPCYNEAAYFMELRQVVADPLMMTRAHELYTSA